MKKLKKVSDSHSLMSSNENENHHKEDCSSDFSFSKVTVRTKKRKKSPYEPNISTIIDLSNHDLSDDVTLVSEGTSQKLSSKDVAIPLVPVTCKKSSLNYSINVSSDECEQKVGKITVTPKSKHKGKMFNDCKTNEPKKRIGDSSMNFESEFAINESLTKIGQINMKNSKEIEDSSDEEGFIFQYPKKDELSKTKAKDSEISEAQIEKQKHKNKIQNGLQASVERLQSKVREPVENCLDSPPYRVSRSGESTDICTVPRLRQEEVVLDVDLNQSYLIKKKLKSPLKRNKHKIRENNDSNVVKEVITIDNQSECIEEYKSRSGIKFKNKHTKLKKEEEIGLIWKSLNEYSKKDDEYYYENVVLKDCDSEGVSSNDLPKSKEPEFEKKLRSLEANSEFESSKLIQSKALLTTEINPSKSIKMNNILKPKIDKRKKKEKEKTVKNDQVIDSLNLIVTKKKKKKKHTKKRELDEIEILKAQVIKKVLEERNTQSNKVPNNDKIDSNIKEVSNKHGLETALQDPLAANLTKKKDKKKKSDKIQDMTTKLLSNALKRFESPKKCHTTESKDFSKTIQSEISPSTSTQNLPSLVNHPSAIQSTSKNSLHSIPFNHFTSPSPTKSKQSKDESKAKRKNSNPPTEDIVSDQVSQITKYNVDSVLTKPQTIPKLVKKKKNYDTKKENSKKAGSPYEKVSSLNVFDKPSKDPERTNYLAVNKSINVTNDNTDSTLPNPQVVSKPVKNKRKHKEKKEKETEILSTDKGVSPTKKKKKHKNVS